MPRPCVSQLLLLLCMETRRYTEHGFLNLDLQIEKYKVSNEERFTPVLALPPLLLTPVASSSYLI